MIITRYIGGLDKQTPITPTDFLIIGGGIAGLFTALKAVKYGKVVVLTKKTIKDSISKIPWKLVPGFVMSRRLMF